jgi:hypothetical protein
MGHLARAIVWGIFDEGDKLRLPFRVTHSSCLDLAGAPVSLDEKTQVGIVHAAHLRDEERMIWGDLWTDLDLVPPFLQLNRNVERLLDHELQAKHLRRFEGRRVMGRAFAELLRSRGWQTAFHGPANLFRPFRRSGQYAVIKTVGYLNCTWPQHSNEHITITDCGVCTIPQNRTTTPAEKYRIKLKDAAPMVIEELLRIILDAPLATAEAEK